VFVALVPERDPEQEPRLRDLVRRTDLLPSVTRAPEVTGCAIPVLLGKFDLPEREVDGRIERRGAPIADLVGVDELLELRGGRAGRRDVGRCQSDLDERRERPHARERFVSLSERTIDPGQGTLHLALRELQKRETGLRGTSELVRGAVGIFGGGEVPSTT